MLTLLTILTIFTIINTKSTYNFYTIRYSQHTVPNLTLHNNTRKKARFGFRNKRTKQDKVMYTHVLQIQLRKWVRRLVQTQA